MPEPSTIAIIAERRHLENRALREAQAAFEAAGYAVALVVPDGDQLFDIPTEAPPWEAVLSRGRDLTGLALLAAASALGVLAINTPQSIELVRNKIAMQAVLLQHGLPLPRTWFASDTSVFRRVPREHFPLVVKPFDGDGAQGIWLLTRPEDIERLPALGAGRSVYLAQPLLRTDGWDLKLYGIGTHVWAVRKPAPVRFEGAGAAVVQATDGAEVVAIDAHLRDIALTCGRACGLDLWGVDVAVTPDGPFVIEVNDFPTYSAVPEAGALIAQHVIGRVQIEAVLREAGRDRTLAVVRTPR
jgi:glutathione synthase/RimK-type ligase-like ATP-grasp enzyme